MQTGLVQGHHRGASVVDIVAALAVLGLLIVFVGPRLSSASESEIKAELDMTVREIDRSVSAYRVLSGGILPSLGATPEDAGWSVLLRADLLQAPPINAYTGLAPVRAGEPSESMTGRNCSGAGWIWSEPHGRVFPCGYDAEMRVLFHGPAFTEQEPAEVFADVEE